MFDSVLQARKMKDVRTAICSRSAAAHGLALLIMLYGGLLRLDAFVGRHGTLDRPAWARMLTSDVAPLIRPLRPSSIVWEREERPYVGGDPINYLKFAREMTWFYQAHVREPVFLAMTRIGLWGLDGQDAAVSFASAAGSTLAIVAAYLVGAALLSPLTGLLAAVLMAIEYEAIAWAPQGWRDDAFTATVLFSAWALIRLRANPSVRRGILAGGLCGLSCLTRITAISFIVPAMLWVVVDGAAASRRARARSGAVAALVLAAVVAPYLISCAIETGDPLFAINYHTSYYRYAEGRPIAEPMTAAEYLRTKFAAHPVATLDTGFNGLFVQPFATKWHGFDAWFGGLNAATRSAALVGLALLPFCAAGRLLLVVLLTSLLPYIFTWNLGGGGEWRFTMHAYPFYLVAAAFAIDAGIRGGRAVMTDRTVLRRVNARLAPGVAGLVIAAAAGPVVYYGLPWLVIREGIAGGESTSLEPGSRDLVFYRKGWSPPHADSITVRVSLGEWSQVRIPLPAKRDYEIVLRIDPVDPARQERVRVLFNRHPVAVLRLGWDPARVGSYRIPLRADVVQQGANELTLIPESLVPAGSAGPLYAWLNPAERIGVRLWYVRVLP